MRFSTLALAALVLAAPAAAFAQDHHGMGMHHFFTPEQRMMYMQAQGAEGWKSMTPDQRHAQAQAMHAKFDAMSDADKQKLRADMQAKFDALPAAQKQVVEQKIAARQARMEQRMQSGDTSKPSGH